MGLDVYLTRIDDFEGSKQRQLDLQKRSDEIWAEASKGREAHEISQTERDEIREKISAVAVELGLTPKGDEPEETKKHIEIPSIKHPEHIFKIGYFRSSYNPGGFNDVLTKLVGEDLYQIFDIPFEPDYTTHNWNRVKDRINEVRAKLVAYDAENDGYHGIVTVHAITARGQSRPKNAAEALALYNEEAKKNREREKAQPDTARLFSSYMGPSGHFFKDPIEVVALIPGREIGVLGPGELPTVYAIYRQDLSWYFAALDVVEETCDYILSQPDPEKYYIRWSG